MQETSGLRSLNHMFLLKAMSLCGAEFIDFTMKRDSESDKMITGNGRLLKWNSGSFSCAVFTTCKSKWSSVMAGKWLRLPLVFIVLVWQN